ncbi:MAG: hypothetical protein M1834_005832 [Cirrosporium novae-zelandiae]|nr:MAG: hypothetical protein M1834_005832 [Cirrosporium novae-zelandiae]
MARPSNSAYCNSFNSRAFFPHGIPPDEPIRHYNSAVSTNLSSNSSRQIPNCGTNRSSSSMPSRPSREPRAIHLLSYIGDKVVRSVGTFRGLNITRMRSFQKRRAKINDDSDDDYDSSDYSGWSSLSGLSYRSRHRIRPLCTYSRDIPESSHRRAVNLAGRGVQDDERWLQSDNSYSDAHNPYHRENEPDGYGGHSGYGWNDEDRPPRTPSFEEPPPRYDHIFPSGEPMGGYGARSSSQGQCRNNEDRGPFTESSQREERPVLVNNGIRTTNSDESRRREAEFAAREAELNRREEAIRLRETIHSRRLNSDGLS